MRGGARPGRWVGLQEAGSLSGSYVVAYPPDALRRHPALPSIPCRATPERSGLVYQHETSLEMMQVFMAGPDDE
jgi:hypothetical protein